MRRTLKRNLNHQRCPNSCLYFLAEDTDSEHGSDKMYDPDFFSIVVKINLHGDVTLFYVHDFMFVFYF